MPRNKIAPPDALDVISDLKFDLEKVAAVHDLCSSSAENPDSSKKGTFDAEIRDLLEVLNRIPHFVSTSSCSGRVILFSQEGSGKGACRWHFVRHQNDFTEDSLVDCLRDFAEPAKLAENVDAVLKFEPFILHVRCRTLADAQILHALSVQAGFRNSGITIRRKGKEGFAIHVAVRCTLHFEMPVTLGGELIVSPASFLKLAAELRGKMDRNAALILRFFDALKVKFRSDGDGNADAIQADGDL
ncbi:putative tRNA wybutosine-synthesizing protein 3-like protein [Hypsibius exemplaris]|uniref:tRNA wybutosine-synthesizing protein 3 homolog n=1 Tax=Hypsibius exemplaris TaxID=2072580 RepID=A0A1W0WFL3_HYPEX|nr:putative tRNA wybutosine-synthesizing protein 3-like protein [Hypsibius exemplaris]